MKVFFVGDVSFFAPWRRETATDIDNHFSQFLFTFRAKFFNQRNFSSKIISNLFIRSPLFTKHIENQP